MLKLYYTPGACALASHIALAESGADYELESVNLRAGEQKTPAFLAINPKGQTPALKTDKGVLTENFVIMGYVAQENPKAGIAPEDSFGFGAMQAFNGYLGGKLHPAMGLFMFGGLEGEARDAAKAKAVDALRFVEDTLFKGPWAMGDRYTVADGYLSVFSRWGRQGGILDDRFPKLNKHLDAVQARPAVRRALREEGIEAV